ncbi:MAG: hypothetical protein ACOYXC_09155 [Candidatus Rifleibacteriota bacterium]
MEIEELKELVRSNNYLQPDIIFKKTSEDELFVNVIDNYIFNLSELRLKLQPNVRNITSNLKINTKILDLIIYDNSSFWALYFDCLGQVSDEILDYCLKSSNIRLQRFGQALCVKDSKFHLISEFGEDLLILMFIHIELDETFLQKNFNPNICTNLMKKLKQNLSSLLNIQLNNLNKLFILDLVEISLIDDFVRAYFLANKYFYGPSIKILETAVNKDSRVLRSLAACRLLIDPFSCATKFSNWLIDTKKFLLLTYLIETKFPKGVPEEFNDILRKKGKLGELMTIFNWGENGRQQLTNSNNKKG